MKKIAVVYHSGYGHTERMAQAVASGAQAELIKIDSEGNLSEKWWGDLSEADAIIFGSPTYMGSVSWQFKRFAESSSKLWSDQVWRNKLFGGFTCSANMNGDKHSTLQYLITLAMQHNGIWIGTGINYNNTKESKRIDVNYLASSLGPMAQTPVDTSGDEMNPGDLETGRLFGIRIRDLVNNHLLTKAEAI